MLVKKLYGLDGFEAWSGAKYTYEKIMELGLFKEFEELLDELFDGEIEEMQLNDFLWFEDDFIFSSLGVKTYDVLQEEIEDLESEKQNLLNDFKENEEDIQDIENKISELKEEQKRW